jgi:GGDEF domain-containing protein
LRGHDGEEFCGLLSNPGSSRALEIGEMVQAAVQNLAMPHATSLYQTVSFGQRSVRTKSNDPQWPGDLIEAALHPAKHRGTNTGSCQ